MKTALKIMLFVLSLTFQSCADLLLEDDPKNDPLTNYNLLWNEFDQFYSQFEVKKINWDSLGHVYRSQITNSTTNDQLYQIMTQLLSHLNDSHVILANPHNPEKLFYSGILNGRQRDDFYLKTVKGHYLESVKNIGSITYGKIAGENIGYIHFANFDDSQKFFADAMLDILEYLDGVEAMIIDVRDNTGGNDATAQLIANRFAEEKKLYMTTRRKSGPHHSDFGPAIEWHTEPKGGRRFAGSTALLTNRWSISSAETFALAMKANSHVVHIGDTTTGAFSDTRDYVLPNGFYTRIPQSDVRDRYGRSYEGIGLAPDIRAINTKEQLLKGLDNVLKTAIEQIH